MNSAEMLDFEFQMSRISTKRRYLLIKGMFTNNFETTGKEEVPLT